MTSASDLYRKMMRLRANIRRAQARLAVIERKLAGKKHRWGGCSGQRNRK